MNEVDDSSLLRDYTGRASEDAFAELVRRHVNKIYSVAWRHTGNAHSAEEITQTVFVILAKKGRQLGPKVNISGWLYQTARFASVSYVRGEIRRARRQAEADMQSKISETETEHWVEIAPLLDAAMAGLNDTDRQAVVMRFFDGKSMKDIGESLNATEDAAKKRVTRAVEKLRAYFARRGVTSTAAGLVEALSAHAVQIAPAGLAASAAKLALAKSAAAGTTMAAATSAVKSAPWLKAATFSVVAANALLSKQVVATHFNWAGQPNGWMTGSSYVWFSLMFGVGMPLFYVALGYCLRFLPVAPGTFKMPNRDYWTAPEHQAEMFTYFFHRFLWLACFEAVFLFALQLLVIQANRQTPPHLSTPLTMTLGSAFVIVVVVWLATLVRHFKKIPE